MQVDYNTLFTLLRTGKEIEVLINPFVNAYLNNVMEQLEGKLLRQKLRWQGFPLPNSIMYYLEMTSL